MVYIMTNKEAKEKAIREAWGKYWDEVKDNVIGMGTYCGWADNDVIHYNEDLGCDSKNFEFITTTGLYRPKQLSGIENNNGWIRIEPDGSNLPDRGADGDYKAYNEKDKTYENHWNKNGIRALFKEKKITHFKPIKEEKPPIW